MTQTAVNYAMALYDLSREEHAGKQILSELQALREAFAREPDFLRLLAAPNISKQERCEVLDRSFREKVHPYVLNFMKLLTEKGNIRHFSDCCKAFESMYHEEHGILPVWVVSAVALSNAQQEKLKDRLEKITGKTVLLENRVDPGCLGGIRLSYDGKQVDGTIQNRLEAVGKLLKNTVL